MTDRELMQQALEALDSGVDVQMGRVVWTEYDSELVEQAITALRERLAQPEQKPVAWRWKERINNDFDSWVVTSSEPPPYAIEQQPLYTAPPRREWVGLTDEEKLHLEIMGGKSDVMLAEAIEAKLREKNA